MKAASLVAEADAIASASTTAQAAGQGLAEAQAAEQSAEMHVSTWALPELIEAATRTGQTQLAAEALGRLAEATNIGQSDWGQGIYARS